MKHQEILILQQQLNALINHCVEKKVDIFHVNYGLDRNQTRLNTAVEAIMKSVSQELKDLEAKVFELCKDKTFDITLLNKKEQARHRELFADYTLAMQDENEMEIFMLDPSKVEGIKIEYPFYLILKQFLPL